ncbi:tetratricopeptide repeat protein [Aquimarina algiphila]|uniref:tetratricopeptide repeat protein n=1 Tax=Aquimarina algiphila TaxID=2047982 RepID=UPI002491328F|nr:hypothetical protein [Aquimarina algiphila]
MKMTQELSEQIEAYIEGSLSGKALTDFKQTIKANPELEEEVKIQTELFNNLRNKKSLDFRKKLIEINKEINDEKASEKSNTFTFWKIAASILILIGISSILWFTNTTSENLFAQYYTPYPIGDIKRGDQTSIDDNFKKVVLNYKKKEYQKVIPFLESTIEKNPNDEQLKLCLGNSYLNTNQFKKAEALFLSFSAESKYYSDAIWFLSLTYLKMEKEEQTISLLEKLSSSNNIHTENAGNLLKDLE